MKRTEKTVLIAIAAYGVLVGYLVVVAALTQTRGVWAGAALVGIRLLTSVMLLAGLRLSERHSSSFPLGLYKLQNLLAVLFGGFIILIAYELMKGNIWKLYAGHGAPHGGLLAFSSLLLSVAVAAFFAWYKERVGRQESCPALVADARNSFADFLAFAGVAISLVLEMLGVRHIHTVITLIVGVYLVYVGGRVVLDGLKVLLDASVDRKILREVGRIAAGHPLVETVVDVSGRSSGGYRFINLSILVVTTDLRQASRVARDIEQQVRSAVHNIDTVRVEFDVKPRDTLLCAVPAGESGGEVNPGFSDAHSLELFEIDIDRASVVSTERFGNPVPPEASGRGARLAVALARRGVDTLLTRGALEDGDAQGALEAYDIEVLDRPDALTMGGAEADILAYAVTLRDEAAGPAGGEPS